MSSAAVPTTMWFDVESHSADAIQRAAYVLSSRLSIELTRDGDRYRCTVQVDPDDVAPEDALRALRKEVVDQVLRERIRNETAPVRNAVLALAFSKLISNEEDA